MKKSPCGDGGMVTLGDKIVWVPKGVEFAMLLTRRRLEGHFAVDRITLQHGIHCAGGR